MFSECIKELVKVAPICLTMAFSGTSAAGEATSGLKHHGLSTPPACNDILGRAVTYIGEKNPANLIRNNIFMAAALNSPKTNKPYIVFDAKLFSMLPYQFQQVVFEHECMHQELGHVLGANKQNYIAIEHGKKEDEADCKAIQKMKNKGTTEEDLLIILDALKVNKLVGASDGMITKRRELLKNCYYQQYTVSSFEIP